MFRKIVLILLRYSLTFLAFLIASVAVVYYIFIFEWKVSSTELVINTALIIICMAVSIGCYWYAEKIRVII